MPYFILVTDVNATDGKSDNPGNF